MKNLMTLAAAGFAVLALAGCGPALTPEAKAAAYEPFEQMWSTQGDDQTRSTCEHLERDAVDIQGAVDLLNLQWQEAGLDKQYGVAAPVTFAALTKWFEEKCA